MSKLSQPVKPVFSDGLVLFILCLMACLGVLVGMLVSDDLISDQYRVGMIFFLLVVVLCWTIPQLKGENIAYPMRSISVIWCIIYGLGPLRWVAVENPYTVVVVYSGAIGLLSMGAGYILGPKFFRRPKRLTNMSRSFPRLKMWLVIFFGLSLAATLLFVIVGGIPALHPNVLTYRFEVRQRLSSYVVFILRSGQLPLYFLWAMYLLEVIKPTPQTRMICLFGIAYTLFVNFIPGWRNPLMFIALNTVFIYAYSGRRVNSFAIFAVGTTAVGGVLTYGFFRLLQLAQTNVVDSVVYFRSVTSSTFEMLTLWATNQFSVYSFGFLTALEFFPERIPYLNGGVLVTTLATMLPGKQELLDEKLKRWTGMEFDGGGLNLSLLGESYADFGYFGLALYPFIYGCIIGVLMRNLRTQPSPARLVLTAFATSSVCLGSLTGLLSLSSFWVIGAFAVFIAMQERRREKHTPVQHHPQENAPSPSLG